jgi:hypothetical protein
MLRFLLLDTADPRLELPAAGPPLPLLYCWTCGVAQSDLWYRVEDDGGVEFLQYGQGGQETDFPYSDYPVYFPQRYVRLRAIPGAIQGAILVKNSGKISTTYSEPGAIPEYEPTGERPESEIDLTGQEPWHQIGGQPLFLDTYWRMKCPLCDGRMPFLAAIGDESGAEKGFTENPYVQVLYHVCPECWCVGAYHQTD